MIIKVADPEDPGRTIDIHQTSRPKKVYLASSWSNPYHEEYISYLNIAGHIVYDYRSSNNFHWTDIQMGNADDWSVDIFLKALKSPTAFKAFRQDFDRLVDCDVCVLLQPAGNDAHLEMGYAAGAGKYTIIHYPPQLMTDKGRFRPGLMVKAAKIITHNVFRMLAAIERA